MKETREIPSTLSVLRSSTLLNALTPDEINGLAQTSHVASVKRGENIWLRGEDVDFFGLISTGFVKMVKGSLSGTDTTLELMGPGQIFGMLGTIEGGGCPLSAFAVTEVVYLQIRKRQFLPIYQANDSFKDRLIRRNSLRLHSALDLLGRMSSGRVDERIAAILFLLAESYGEPMNGGIQIAVPLTRQDLGEMAGTTVESTIRVLSRWQKSGIVSTDHHLITILNEAALSRILAT